MAMKVTLCLCMLLTGLQVHCHHIPGHHDEQEHNRDKNPPENQHQPLAEGQGTETTAYEKIAPYNAEFAFLLYKHVASDPAPQNNFFSSLSISTAFAMLTLGAKGKTRHQIFNGLCFNLSDIQENEIHDGFNQIVHTLNQPNRVTQVNIGNALFVEETLQLLPTFLNDVKTLYGAEGFSTDLQNSEAAEKAINNHVKNKTHGKISQVVKGLNPATGMVLVNYIFFKAHWEQTFNPHSTRETDFFVDANTIVKVNMMYQKGYYDFLHDEDLSCWVVRVPYHGGYAAWFILPDEGKLKDVEDALGAEVLRKWRTSLRHEEIKLHIPKFSISGSYDVKDLLQRQGMNDVFNDEADLSGITGQRNLKVSKAVHKAVLDVHEGGTEAAAVTTIHFQFKSLQWPPPLIIRFDRPFIFFITNQHVQQLIFIGRLVDPTAK